MKTEHDFAFNPSFQKHLEEIASCMPGNFYWKDFQGRYLGCNKAVLNILNFQSVSDIVGKTDYDLWPEQAETLRKHDKIVMETGNPVDFEEEVTMLDGKRMYFAVIKMPLRDQDGKVIGVLGTSSSKFLR